MYFQEFEVNFMLFSNIFKIYLKNISKFIRGFKWISKYIIISVIPFNLVYSPRCSVVENT